MTTGDIDRIRVDVKLLELKVPETMKLEWWMVGIEKEEDWASNHIHSMNENNFYVAVIKNGCGFSYQII